METSQRPRLYITLEAISEYGILRLASRINDLKRRGYKIHSTTRKGNNRYGESTHYKVYKLVEENGGKRKEAK
ncbi:MAG: hypothetical protein IJX51_08665 [Clostridia bacterium]|nr:hypothetical protein [Clostridia bacterium]